VIAKKGIDDIREDSEEIIYMLSAEKGMDGSPLICLDAYQRFSIIGIHRGGLRKGGDTCVANVGRLISSNFIAFLDTQRRKLGGESLSTTLQIVKEIMSGSKPDSN
jgi:hypothetical protein